MVFNWSLVLTGIAALGGLLAGGWAIVQFVRARDVSVVVRARSGAGELKARDASVGVDEALDLVAVNQGGKRAYLREIQLSVPPELEFRAPTGDWKPCKPDPDRAEGWKGWCCFLWTVPARGRRELPPLVLKDNQEWSETGGTRRSVAQWGVWWRFLWWRSGQGGAALRIENWPRPVPGGGDGE